MDNTIQINKFFLSYGKLLENKDEKEFVISLSEIAHEITPENFNNIENIKYCMFDLEKQKFLFAYKMLLLTYIKFCFCEKMKNLFDNINFVFTVDIVVDKIKILQNFSTYIDSFKNISISIMPISQVNIKANSITENDNNNTITNTKNNKYVNIWYIETRLDILSRFNCLKEYFGLEQLNKFKIKNITYDEIYNMNFKKLAKYYNKTIARIKKEIKKSIQLCNIFLEIEEQFVLSMITSNSNLELNNFSLEIEFGDDTETIDQNSDADSDSNIDTVIELNENIEFNKNIDLI